MVCKALTGVEKMLVVLRDGKKILGVLRSFDQYGTYPSCSLSRGYWLVGLANLVLQDAIERIFVGDIYGDIFAGIYVIRGENVVLLGEIVQTPFWRWADRNTRTWIKKTRNYLNVVCQDKKPKKRSTEKLSRENAGSDLRIEFFMAWSILHTSVDRLLIE